MQFNPKALLILVGFGALLAMPATNGSVLLPKSCLIPPPTGHAIASKMGDRGRQKERFTTGKSSFSK